MSELECSSLSDLLQPPKLEIEDGEKLRQIEEELSCLVYNEKTCRRIKNVFRDEMAKGIQSRPSSLRMVNTFVSRLPDGKEEGKFLALDLGGTNFRVLLVEFRSGQMVDVQDVHYHISEQFRLGNGRELFDYMAECISDFLTRKQLKGQSIPLGFTFSFPMAHRSLKSGVLVKWTKTFNCSGVEGRDVAKLLDEALSRKGCHGVSVYAVLNDTTGTLMMGSYMDSRAYIGLILGTGSNACYLEKHENVKHWETENHGDGVVINVEWGAFGDNGVLDFIQTRYDVEVDNNSLLVNSFTFEKYISGNYLGEIVRVILVSLMKKGLLFGKSLTNLMHRSNSFSTAMVSMIEQCTIDDTQEDVLRIIESFGITDCTRDDLIVVQHVCRIVSDRSALLVSICLSALLDRVDKSEITVAVDGSLYQKHPRYRHAMQKYTEYFTTKKFKLMEAVDGSGRGAALVAAMAFKIEEKHGDF